MTIKQFGSGPPDSFVEREKSCESRSPAPGFISGARFLQSSIKNRKSKVLGYTIFDFRLKIEDWQ
jgi:hypothetical protein